MRTSLLLAIAGLATIVSVSACGDASSSTNQRSHGAVPQDSSEEPGAPTDPDPSSPPNPNATTPPKAPTTTGTPAAGGEFAVALSTATPSADLGTSLDVTVTVTPKAGFTGTAALTATGLPAGVTATFVPASVTLNTTAVTSKLTLAVAYTTVPSTAAAPAAIVISATAGTVAATANANFKVNPQVTLTVPVNASALLAAGGGAKDVDGWGGATFGTQPVALQTQGGNGITFLVKNLDSAPHEVHGNAGFAHGSAVIAPGALDNKSRVLDPAAANISTSGYIHNAGGLNEGNGTAVGFKVMVNKAP